MHAHDEPAKNPAFTAARRRTPPLVPQSPQAPAASAGAGVLNLQRLAGNAAVTRALSGAQGRAALPVQRAGGTGEGTYGYRKRDREEREAEENVPMSGATHESEHVFGFHSASRRSGQPRGQRGPAGAEIRRHEREMGAYHEVEPAHSAHIGTGTRNQPDHTNMNSHEYRDRQEEALDDNDAFHGVAINQVGYSGLPQFHAATNTPAGRQADRSYGAFIQANPPHPYYTAPGQRETAERLTPAEQVDAIGMRHQMRTGQNLTQQEIEALQRRFGARDYSLRHHGRADDTGLRTYPDVSSSSESESDSEPLRTESEQRRRLRRLARGQDPEGSPDPPRQRPPASSSGHPSLVRRPTGGPSSSRPAPSLRRRSTSGPDDGRGGSQAPSRRVSVVGPPPARPIIGQPPPFAPMPAPVTAPRPGSYYPPTAGGRRPAGAPSGFGPPPTVVNVGPPPPRPRRGSVSGQPQPPVFVGAPPPNPFAPVRVPAPPPGPFVPMPHPAAPMPPGRAPRPYYPPSASGGRRIGPPPSMPAAPAAPSRAQTVMVRPSRSDRDDDRRGRSRSPSGRSRRSDRSRSAMRPAIGAPSAAAPSRRGSVSGSRPGSSFGGSAPSGVRVVTVDPSRSGRHRDRDRDEDRRRSRSRAPSRPPVRYESDSDSDDQMVFSQSSRPSFGGRGRYSRVYESDDD